jgi:type IV pilus assembly protein PilV
LRRPTFNHKQHAFGLIEVLISAVILSIGLLGLASLQSRSIQTLQEGDNLVTASMLAREMAQRMMSNPYELAQGRQGYLATDISGAIATAGDVPTWAANTLSGSPNITGCYSANDTESCYNPGGSTSSSSDHIAALANMELMDEVELRSLAWNILPQGEIMICFDASGALTTWACDDTATRVSARKENVFTVKVRWNNLFTNTKQMYTLQFTGECDDGSGSFCG